jgi:hypothetical protein
MDKSSPRIRSLLRQADKVAASGKRVAAEKLYRQIIEESPETTPAWVGLALVVSDTAEQGAAIERAYELDPENERAKIGLTAFRNGQSVVEALKSEPESQPNETVAAQPERNRQERPTTKKAPVDSVQSPAKTVHDDHIAEAVEIGELLYCANHPNRKTNLRCNKCGKPVCTKCIKPTPVGYRCKECIKEHQDVFFSASIIHYLIAAAVAFPLAMLAGFIAGRVGFLVIFLAAFAGSIIARIVHRVVGRRRGRWMPLLVAGAVLFGGAIWVLPALPFLLSGDGGLGVLGGLGLIWNAIYIVVATSAAYYQMK